MEVSSILIQGSGGSCTFSGNPGIPHGAFGIIIGILQLLQVMINALRGAFFTVAAFQTVQGHSDGTGLLTPISLRFDGVEGSGVLLYYSPWSGVGYGQFPVCGRFGGE